ncbi:hypothetical protein V6N11_031145 [Hibiscus sabdariffa]|uniref:Uncharacterized protein n=1 Tax=Hibiscus sabdariffa TaxID=183260 RepID=A0ABR2N9X6_9ROSI
MVTGRKKLNLSARAATFKEASGGTVSPCLHTEHPPRQPSSHQWPSIPPNRQAKQSAKPAMPWPTKLRSLAYYMPADAHPVTTKGSGQREPYT